MALARGAYLRQTIRCSMIPAGLQIDFDRRQGSYRPWWREMSVTIHGLSTGGQVSSAGREIPVRYDGQSRTQTLLLPDMPEGHAMVR